MQAVEIAEVLGDTPHTTPARGRTLHEFVIRNKLKRCLELGFAHGVGTVWLAGAVQELGGGKVIAVDNESALKRKPSAREMIAKAGLSSLIELHFDPISYTWHLKRNLAEYQADPFDFIFLDGAHTWDVDGFTFFLAEKILKPGGWILFDDLDWSFAISASLKNSEFVAKMPEEQRAGKQVRAVWENLVLTHPNFGNFIEETDWGWAQKTMDQHAPRRLEIRRTSKSLPQRIMRRIMAQVG